MTLAKLLTDARLLAEHLADVGERVKQQNAELDALADEIIREKRPGWRNFKIIRQRDIAIDALRQMADTEQVVDADPLSWAVDAHDLARETLDRIESVGGVE